MQSIKKSNEDTQVPTDLISRQHDLRSGAAWLASGDAAVRDKFLNDLTEGELLALPYLFEFWAHDHQLPPEGQWRTWVILGGRGAGKTRAGAEWVRTQVEGPLPLHAGRAKRVALIGETYEQARDIMVFGESGILAASPPDRRPEWRASRRQLVWSNGATATVYSAHDPEALRGPQFDALWADELAKWKRGQEAWDMAQFALRLGEDPRQCVTTTPKNVAVLKSLLANPSTVTTTAPTEANRAFLAQSFLEEVRTRYSGTRLGRQELDGVLLDTIDGALWTPAMLEAARGDAPEDFARIVVAVDPPATGRQTSDDCGIIVAGIGLDGRAYILQDATISAASPMQWAKRVLQTSQDWSADRVIAEVNQGGDLVETLLRQIDPDVPYRPVRATHGKIMRAEPVAALYEQGRVVHCGVFSELEDQMMQMTLTGYHGNKSPDRADALVWALHELVLSQRSTRPALRVL